jgi:hypothetical protein
MRQLHVLPASKVSDASAEDLCLLPSLSVIGANFDLYVQDLCMSIKSRTRRALNKAGAMDTKCSYHATVHIMEPASRHRIIITKILEMVKKVRNVTLLSGPMLF